jgi:hypothetical protein
MSQLVSEHYEYNTSHTVLFSKTAFRIRLDAHIRTIVVLISGKLAGIYFLHLLSIIYFPVMSHRWKGKKVSILPPDDVNPGPVPSRWGLLQDSLYRVLDAACPSCARGCVSIVRLVTITHLGRGDLRMSCGLFLKMWIRSCNVCRATLNAWAPLGG